MGKGKGKGVKIFIVVEGGKGLGDGNEDGEIGRVGVGYVFSVQLERKRLCGRWGYHWICML